MLIIGMPHIEALMIAVCVGYGIMLLWDVVLLYRYFPSSDTSAFLFLRWVDEFQPLAFTGLFVNLGLFTHLVQLHHAGFKEGIKDVPEHILDEILENFKMAFNRAKKAGFDGIEIHGAHTYLISQLNSRLWNLREDKYGGTFEKRMYFSKKLIEETRTIFNDDFILGYRMGGNEPELKDGIAIAKYLEKLGVAPVQVKKGDTFAIRSSVLPAEYETMRSEGECKWKTGMPHCSLSLKNR